MKHQLDVRTDHQKAIEMFYDVLSPEQKIAFTTLFGDDEQVELAIDGHKTRKQCIESGEHLTKMKTNQFDRSFCKRCGYHE